MDWQSSEVFNMKLNCYMLNQSFEMLKSIFIHLFHCFCNHYWGFFSFINANYLNWIMEKARECERRSKNPKSTNFHLFRYFYANVCVNMENMVKFQWWCGNACVSVPVPEPANTIRMVKNQSTKYKNKNKQRNMSKWNAWNW